MNWVVTQALPKLHDERLGFLQSITSPWTRLPQGTVVENTGASQPPMQLCGSAARCTCRCSRPGQQPASSMPHSRAHSTRPSMPSKMPPAPKNPSMGGSCTLNAFHGGPAAQRSTAQRAYPRWRVRGEVEFLTLLQMHCLHCNAATWGLVPARQGASLAAGHAAGCRGGHTAPRVLTSDAAGAYAAVQAQPHIQPTVQGGIGQRRLLCEPRRPVVEPQRDGTPPAARQTAVACQLALWHYTNQQSPPLQTDTTGLLTKALHLPQVPWSGGMAAPCPSGPAARRPPGERTSNPLAPAAAAPQPCRLGWGRWGAQ